MQGFSVQKVMMIVLVFLGVWLGAKYLLPLAMPFVLGSLLALAAEPAVGFVQRKLGMKRSWAAGIGVSLTLVFLLGLMWLAGALAVKELGQLTRQIPDVQGTVEQGIQLLRDATQRAADRLPEEMGRMVTGTAQQVLGSSSQLMETVTGWVPSALKALLGWLPDGALGLGTGILSGFMLSARLPRLKQLLRSRLPESWREIYAPKIKQFRKTLGGWLKAQGKLLAVTYGIVSAGFLLLGISGGLFWAVLVALVDAVPILGTGTVLLPWALVELLQGQTLRGVGLVVVYGCALFARTALEPKLVGRHLGLDPLLTLVFLYIGYRIWGIWGMIFAPILAAAVKGITETTG